MEDVHVKDEELSSDDSSEVDERNLFLTEPIKIEYFADSVEYVNVRDSQCCKEPLESSVTIENPFPIDQKEIQDDPLRETKHTVDQCNDFNSLASSQPRHSVQGVLWGASGCDKEVCTCSLGRISNHVTKLFGPSESYSDNPQFGMRIKHEPCKTPPHVASVSTEYLVEPVLNQDPSPYLSTTVSRGEWVLPVPGEEWFEYRYDQCEKMFAFESLRQIHQHAQDGNNPVECSYCQKQFSRLSHLKSHLRNLRGEVLFECRHCAETFWFKCALVKHKEVHAGKLFECRRCSETFPCKRTLLRHTKTHADEKPFQCGQCTKTFWYEQGLLKHEKTHPVQKPFECSQCAERFSTESFLLEHQKVHAVGKPFKCYPCNRSFNRQYHLKAHQAIHNG